MKKNASKLTKNCSITCGVLIVGLWLNACGRSGFEARQTTAGGTPGTAADDAKAIKYSEKQALHLLGANGDLQRAVWDREPHASEWTATLLDIIHEKKDILDKSRDIEGFCPGYSQQDSFKKDTCWLRIISAISLYESGMDPSATYVEEDGATSTGLLMMNPDHCPNAPTIAALKDAEKNIRCAMERFTMLVGRDGVISNSSPYRGAALYWSVLRAPYQYKTLRLGKLLQIYAFTRSYAGYQE